MSVTYRDAVLPEETEHALLVPLGHFAREIGLIDALGRVPFEMKTVRHSPGEKLGQLVAHILAGGIHVKELDKSPHPLVEDGAVARAWKQDSFASASGVSDLLRAGSQESVAALKLEVRGVIEPYRRRIIRESVACGLVVDLDLTGLVVSDQAKGYEGADYGFIGEVSRVAKGYQFARALLVGSHDTLLLGGFLHPGHVGSRECLAELVALVEAELGKPCRRVQAVEERLLRVEEKLERVEATLGKARAGSRQEGNLRLRADELRAEMHALEARVKELRAENAANPNPRRILLRLDGGFGYAKQLTWLYEQGYDFVARVGSRAVVETLRKEAGLGWEKVSKNGFIAETGLDCLGECPYRMRLFACRQHRGEDKDERWMGLVVNWELEAKAWPARRVGDFYNHRQVAEASIKEGKGVFSNRHLPTRHKEGIAIYQELVVLAQNLIRWFCRHLLNHTLMGGIGIKALVHIAANCRALVLHQGRAVQLHFNANSPWPGLMLSTKPEFNYQLWFPFLEDQRLCRPSP